ncbi:hypothetical protein D3C86_2240140 [compost metagenome]
MYYIGFLDKNRGGEDKKKICFLVDKGKNQWTELGYLILSEDEKEFISMKKEHKKLKQEEEVRRIKGKLGK